MKKMERRWLTSLNSFLLRDSCSLRSSLNTLGMTIFDCCRNFEKEQTIGVQLPSVEVRYKNLHVEAECEVVHGKPLPTLWNSFQSLLSVVTACQNLYKNSFTYHCLPGHGFRFIILFLR
ncbi:hypothetical protein Hdeb2414_s0016g00485981 [Helianthus debilis subsp. tardiflorus]